MRTLLIAASLVVPAALAAEGGYVGVLVRESSITLEARVGGRVAAVPARLGDRVPRGALLVRLEDDETRRKEQGAGAAHAAAAAQLARARSELAIAEERLHRRTAVPDLFAAEEVTLAREQVTMSTAEVERTKAELERARIALEQARADHAASRIVAPFDGVVAETLHRPGEAVPAGEPLVRMVGSGGLRVRFAVPAADRTALAEGASVRVALSGGADLRGIVKTIAPDVDEASGMVFVEAALDAVDGALPAGGAVRVHLRR